MAAKPYYIQKLHHVYADRKRNNPRYSMGAFSESLGVSKSNLSRILSYQRLPNTKTVDLIASRLKLKATEKRAFLRSTLDAGHAKSLVQRAAMPAVEPIKNDDFEVIGDWYHVAILELVLTDDFRYDARWIGKRVGVTADEAAVALNRLIRLGLLREEMLGGKKTVVRTGEKFSTLDQTKTSPHLKKWYGQLLEKAAQSLEKDSIESRPMRCLTVSANPEQLALVGAMIQEFLRSVSDVLECGPQTEVYNLSVALFPLTAAKKRSDRK